MGAHDDRPDYIHDPVQNPERRMARVVQHEGLMKDTQDALGFTGFAGPALSPMIRTFDTGATRNIDDSKFDYEGFISPAVLFEYARYMHEHRQQKDGATRPSDNWQKGIPRAVYVKSLVRHTLDLWRLSRGYTVLNPDTKQPSTMQELCCAVMFNVMGLLKETVDPSAINKGV